MEKINRIKVLSFGIFQAVLTSLLGIVCGILYSFGGLIYDVGITGGVNNGTALAFLALLGMPIIFGALGLVLGLIEAILYNQFVKWFGGLSINFIYS